MNNFDLNLCIFSSTKGHWGVKSRYLETLNQLDELGITELTNNFAHIKVSPGEETFANNVMKFDFEESNFTVMQTIGDWSHGENHQIEYLKDMRRMFFDNRVNQNQYTLFLEDDWLFDVRIGHSKYYLNKAIFILKNSPDVVTVRFPRFANEEQRILGLKKKHNIDSYVAPAPRGHETFYFLASDHSNNPFICRTKDFYNALVLLDKINGLPGHAEHGLGAALKLLSNSNTPIAIFDPLNVCVRHIGTKRGDEDIFGEDIISD